MTALPPQIASLVPNGEAIVVEDLDLRTTRLLLDHAAAAICRLSGVIRLLEEDVAAARAVSNPSTPETP